ncbi:hypothetical protein QZH41_019072, partial [Actinostola sp. cb2023]
ASCESGGNEFSPRPPRDNPKYLSDYCALINISASHSPYASRKLPPKRSEPSIPTARSLWMSAMKNGTGALSTNSTGMNTWAGGRPSHANKRRPGSRTRNFSDVVELSNGKSKSVSRSATLSYTEPYVAAGGPALKPAEDYYDEIIELKKIINLLKEENNRVNTKLHRVEEENVIKDRRIEDLLNSRKQPEDLRRTLTDKRGDSSSIVTSLKQKLHAVERTVKEKEAELNKMRRDLKTTDVDELNIQSEVYYQEVQRLQLALLQMQQQRVDELYTTDSMLSPRDKSPVSASQQRLQKDIEILKTENKSLKRELISSVENQSKTENKKQLNVDYADMSRGQLLHTIHELEMKVDESGSKSNLQKDKDEQDERKGSKRKKTRERKGSTSSTYSTAEDKETELLEENEKQRKIIERLKEDRTHYRLVADNLRKQLKVKETELEELQLQLPQSETAAAAPNRKASTASTTRNVRNAELSESGESDEDVVIGRSSGTSGYRKMSSHSSDKSPFSAKKRSSFTEFAGSSTSSPPQPIPRTKPSMPHPTPRSLKTPPSPTLHTTPATPPSSTLRTTPPSPTLRTTPHSSTLRTTPPSPTPRRTQRTVPVHRSDDDDDSDDDVVIGGSPQARTG